MTKKQSINCRLNKKTQVESPLSRWGGCMDRWTVDIICHCTSSPPLSWITPANRFTIIKLRVCGATMFRLSGPTVINCDRIHWTFTVWPRYYDSGDGGGQMVNISAANRSIGEVVQSRRRPILVRWPHGLSRWNWAHDAIIIRDGRL